MSPAPSRSRRRAAVVCGLVLCVLFGWFAAGSARAQLGLQQVLVRNTVELAIPASLREAPPPPAAGLIGKAEHFFSDGAGLVLWVQSAPAPGLARLPSAVGESTDELVQGLRAGLPGAQKLHIDGYDPARGALAFGFDQRAGGAEGAAIAISGVAFLTREASVIALLAAPPERSAELRGAARSLWQQSRVSPEARLPIAAEQAFRAGRFVGIALGSLLGGGLLLCGLAWLLARLGVARASSIDISGIALVLVGALLVVLAGSPETMVQLCSYVLAGGLCRAALPRWWAARQRGRLFADERGLSTVEYVIVLVLLAAVSIGAWSVFGDSVRSRLAGTDQLLSGTFSAAEAEGASNATTGTASGAGVSSASRGSVSSAASAATGTASNAAPGAGASASLSGAATSRRPASATSAPGSGAPGSGAPGASGSSTAGSALSRGLVPTGSGSPPAAAGSSTGSVTASGSAPSNGASATVTASGSAPAGSSASPGGASAPSAPPPTLLERARASTPVQATLGVATGLIQSFIPLGFVLPSPAPKSQAFETGRGVGQLVAGVAQVIGGKTMTTTGTAAAVAGVVGAPETGGTSLVLTGAGTVLSAEGVVVTAHGATTVGAGLATLAHAATMSSTPGSGGGSTPTPAPASGPGSPPPGKPPPLTGRAARAEELAKDPAHGGQVSARTRGEAEVGMGLEDAGKVQGLRRDPTGAGEFIDAKGTTWDVKGFNSNFPAKKGGFEVNAAMKSIQREVGLGENVMVDTRSMTAAHVQELQAAVANSSLTDKVLFWP